MHYSLGGRSRPTRVCRYGACLPTVGNMVELREFLMPLTEEQKQILTPLAEKLNALRERDQEIADSALKYRDHPGMFPPDFEAGLLADARRVKADLAKTEAEYGALWNTLNIPAFEWEADEERMRRLFPNWNGRDSQTD